MLLLKKEKGFDHMLSMQKKIAN